jgi:hypothetical protein
MLPSAVNAVNHDTTSFINTSASQPLPALREFPYPFSCCNPRHQENEIWITESKKEMLDFLAK